MYILFRFLHRSPDTHISFPPNTHHRLHPLLRMADPEKVPHPPDGAEIRAGDLLGEGPAVTAGREGPLG